MQVGIDAQVAAPPDVTFAVATDFANWPGFISAIRDVEILTPGPASAGTRFRETRLMFGRAATEEMTVAEFEPPRRFLLTAFNHGTAYRVEHLVKPHEGGTRLVLVFGGKPQSLPSRLLAPVGWIFAGVVKRQLEADLADLEREAERRHAKREAP